MKGIEVFAGDQSSLVADKLTVNGGDEIVDVVNLGSCGGQDGMEI